MGVLQLLAPVLGRVLVHGAEPEPHVLAEPREHQEPAGRELFHRSVPFTARLLWLFANPEPFERLLRALRNPLKPVQPKVLSVERLQGEEGVAEEVVAGRRPVLQLQLWPPELTLVL